MSSAPRLLSTIAWRFLRGRQSRLLDGTARAALAATALGVTAMVIGMAVMSGYRDDLRKKLTRGQAALLVYPLDEEAFELDAETEQSLTALEYVETVRHVTYGQGALTGTGNAGRSGADIDVTIRGVDDLAALDGLGGVEWSRVPEIGGKSPGVLPIVAGHELATRLPAAASPGSAEDGLVRLMVLAVENGRPRFRYGTVRVIGTFDSGLSEFDQKLVVMERSHLEGLAGSEVGDTLFELQLTDVDMSSAVAEKVRDLLGSEFVVMDWRELNSDLFTALRLQQIALFLVLGLIVLVSTFNVASTLVVLVREKMRDIGVLASLGMAPRQIRNLFLFYGIGLSAFGALFGVALGALVSWVLTRYELIRFDPELASIYFLSSVPLHVRWLDVLAVLALTLAVTCLACWLPARRAARVLPARALRYE